jgi:hypothetical protein
MEDGLRAITNPHTHLGGPKIIRKKGDGILTTQLGSNPTMNLPYRNGANLREGIVFPQGHEIGRCQERSEPGRGPARNQQLQEVRIGSFFFFFIIIYIYIIYY